MIPTLFPWQQKQWQQFILYKQQNRLPHALLLTGVPGLGKKHFAEVMTYHLLCAESEPCGNCSHCHLLKAKTHPDVILVAPEKAGQAVKIDAIRNLAWSLHETSLKGSYKIAIIHSAHALNRNAANALLKTLEEPARDTIIILISDHRLAMPATILSRCQKIMFHSPSLPAAKAWLGLTDADSDWLLKFSQGAPLKAKENRELGLDQLRQAVYASLDLLFQGKMDPLLLAKKWHELDQIELILNLLYFWMRDVLCFKLTGAVDQLIYSDDASAWGSYKISTERCLQCMDELQQTLSYWVQGFNLNKQLCLENLLIKWIDDAPN